MWFYQSGSEPSGPHDTDEIAKLIGDAAIQPSTLMWSADLVEWTPANKLSAFAKYFPPPPLPTSLAPDAPTQPEAGILVDDSFVAEFENSFRSQPLATGWGRYFARMIDVNMLGLSAAIVIGVSTASYAPAAYVFLTNYEFAFGIAVVACSSLLCALCHTMFGNTPGKAILGIRVSPLGRVPSFGFHLNREIEVLFAGLAMGIPIIALFTMIQQHRRLLKGQPASYDVGRANVLVKASKQRTQVGFVVWAAALLFTVFLVALDKVDAQAVTTTRLWTNPWSGKAANIAETWQDRPVKGDNVVYLASDYLFAEALIGVEEVGDVADELAYGEALSSALSNIIRVEPPWRPVNINGREVYEAHAIHSKSPDVDVLITVDVVGKSAWRTLLFAVGRKVEDHSDLMKLKNSIWDTIPGD